MEKPSVMTDDKQLDFLEITTPENLKKSIRRHHASRLLKTRRHHWGRDLLHEEGRIKGKTINTPTPCSCAMCGNPRKFFNEKTIQERRFEQEKLIAED
jgi:hypothetical protein